MITAPGFEWNNGHAHWENKNKAILQELRKAKAQAWTLYTAVGENQNEPGGIQNTKANRLGVDVDVVTGGDNQSKTEAMLIPPSSRVGGVKAQASRLQVRRGLE